MRCPVTNQGTNETLSHASTLHLSSQQRTDCSSERFIKAECCADSDTNAQQPRQTSAAVIVQYSLCNLSRNNNAIIHTGNGSWSTKIVFASFLSNQFRDCSNNYFLFHFRFFTKWNLSIGSMCLCVRCQISEIPRWIFLTHGMMIDLYALSMSFI